MSDKVFSTLAVASAATGVGLSEGLNYSLMMEIGSHVLGFPIWTHELADRPLMARVHDALLAQFPGLPTKDEALNDWRAAAAKATAAYGEQMTVREGTGARDESPIDSLARIAGDKPIIVVTDDAS
jgi:hypothetical protein